MEGRGGQQTHFSCCLWPPADPPTYGTQPAAEGQGAPGAALGGHAPRAGQRRQVVGLSGDQLTGASAQRVAH